MAPIGREHAESVLREELRRTVSSHGGLVLVTGEAGIGKTALLTHVVSEFQAEALVLTGTAWSGDGVPGYWPWVQILRGLRTACCPEEWDGIVSGAGAALMLLIDPSGAADSGVAGVLPVARGESRPVLSHPANAPQAGGDQLFGIGDAVTTALVSAARRRPLVVVIDDLHRADAESIRLLTFVARHSWFERIALLAALRDTDLHSENELLRTAFAELWSTARTIELAGLPAADIAALAARATGRTVPADIAARMTALTGGNPFLAEQTARLWHSGSPMETLTPGVRETLEARLAPLPGQVVDVLTTAAFSGREFGIAVLQAAFEAGGPSAAEVPGALTVAERARLIQRPDEARAVFVHDLVRETLMARVDGSEARSRHEALIVALERVPREVSRATPGDLAHHAYAASDDATDDRALGYLLAAANDACGRMAPGEVAQHLARALTVFPVDQPARRAELELDLAAAWHSAGDLPGARRVYADVIRSARARSDAELFARAALGLHELGMPDPEGAAAQEIELIDAAHALYIAQRSAADPLAVRLLAAAARVRVHTGSSRRTTDSMATAETMSADALRLARRSGDGHALGLSLVARHDAIWRPGTAAERLALADEIHALGERSEDDDLRGQGFVLRIAALLELGDPRTHLEQAAFTAFADRSRLPRPRFMARSRAAALAVLAGRFDEAAQAMDSAYALGERIGEVDRLPLWLEQRWALALTARTAATDIHARYRELGGAYPIVPRLIEAARLLDPEGPLFGAGDDSAVTAGGPDRSSGDPVDVEARFATVRGGFDEVRALLETYPRHFHAGPLVALAYAAIVLDEPEPRKIAWDALWPLRGLWAVVAGGGAVYGPYSYWLGRLMAAQDPVAATTELESAVAAARRLRAAPWVAAAERASARMHSGGPRGEALRDHAAMEPSGAVFRLADGVWTLRFGGRTLHLPAAKGLRDLHTLVSHPGQEISALELAGGPGAAEVVRGARRLGADTVLDERAKAEYRRRLTHLDAEIERARELFDDGRAAAADAERAALLDELRRAAGLGGRTRLLGDDAERARKTVSARIRDSLRRIERGHPALGEHLRACVALGVVCRYEPQRDIRWTV
ncbi:AAA family ATPase [Nocardia huaxiensis]|uniref:AAA family ATPase n=1 Tax=Nocardia huaxiensis TaxID=2755382 RepID=A0A7D6V613_9NOCA|nr:AAA family ATPase [Nocardia huaxiensis]QLY28341.1 AAA family ATPase [Nocardia huaxiensis]